VVENETMKYNGKDIEVAMVYRLDGTKIGPLSTVLKGIGFLPGMLYYHQTTGSPTFDVPIRIPDLEGITGEVADKILCYGKARNPGEIKRR